jgi:hypothetical protein
MELLGRELDDLVQQVEKKRQGRTADLPLFRRSITPGALTWKSLQQPSSRASTLLTGYFPYL